MAAQAQPSAVGAGDARDDERPGELVHAD